jgi:hypothetical protein
MTDAKTRRTLLPSAARTATTTSAIQKDAGQQCIRVYLNITVSVAGTGGLKVFVRGYDLTSGVPAQMNTGGAAAITATGIYVYELMPNASAAAGDVLETVGRVLPCVWDVQVTHGDGSSYTYSVGVEVMPG